MIKKILSVFTFLCTCYSLSAQTYLVKNVEKPKEKITNDTSEVSRLNELAYQVRYSNPEAMRENSQQALFMARGLKFAKGEATALRNLGIYHVLQSNEAKGRTYFKQSLALFWQLKDSIEAVKIINGIGISHFKESNHTEALKHYQKALALLANYPEEYSVKSDMLTNIGIIYRLQKDTKKALIHYRQAYKIAEQTRDKASMATIRNNIASIYQSEQKYARAEKLYQQNIESYKKANDQLGVLLSRGNLGICQCRQQQTTQGIANLQAGLNGFRQTNQKYFQAEFLNFLGECYTLKKDYHKGQEHFLAALALAKNIKHRKESIKSLKYLFELHKKQKNFETSLYYHERYQQLKDSTFTQENTQKLLALQTHYETGQKEKALEIKSKQIELLKKTEANERLQKQALIGLLTTVSIISGLVILLLRLMVRKKRSIIAKNKELYQTQQHLHEAKLNEEKLTAENLQKALDLKNQQLSSKALHIIQKNEMLQKVRTDLKQVNAKGKRSKELFQIMQSIDYSFSLDKDWLNFFNFFEEIHPDFFDTMKNKAPNLSYQDLRLCALVKLRFSSKEMSSILGIAPGSVSVARHRVRKKLEVPKEQRLSDFIASA